MVAAAVAARLSCVLADGTRWRSSDVGGRSKGGSARAVHDQRPQARCVSTGSVRRVLVSDDSIGRIVGRSGVGAGDLAVLEPIGELRDTSPPRRLQPIRVRGDWAWGASALGAAAGLRRTRARVRHEDRSPPSPQPVGDTCRRRARQRGELQEHGRREAWHFLPSIGPWVALSLWLFGRPSTDTAMPPSTDPSERPRQPGQEP